MKLPINLRGSFARLVLLCATIIAAGLLLPVYSTASQTGVAHAEERAQERTTHAEERAARAQEREARQAAHREEREARQNDRRSRHDGSNETGETGAGQPPAGPATRPSGKADRECRPTIKASSTRITAGEMVTLSGTLGCPASANTAEQTPSNATDAAVTIYQRQIGAGAESFAALGAAAPEADGSFTLTSPALNTNTVFKVREGRRAARVLVDVAPLVTLAISTPDASTSSDAKVPKHPKVTFTGTVNPINTGAIVALQVASAGTAEQWRVVAFGRVAADGGYSIDHTFKTPGSFSVRAVVHGKRLNAAGVSEVLSYTASQPQNPQLTIQASADPVSSGATVTISGVAAGAANEPVKLLARTAGVGAGYAVVAEASTDAEGNYTFTQTPVQNTYYVVSDATAQSTPLFEGVALALALEAAPTTVQSGQQLTFSGTVLTAPTGQLVYLEREYASGLGFHVIGATPVNASSQFTIAHTFAGAGQNVLRIKVPGNAQHLPTVSAPFTVTVKG